MNTYSLKRQTLKTPKNSDMGYSNMEDCPSSYSHNKT